MMKMSAAASLLVLGVLGLGAPTAKAADESVIRPVPVVAAEVTRENLTEGPGLQVRQQGLPRRVFSRQDEKSWAQAVFAGDVVSLVWETNPIKIEIENMGYDEFVHVLEGRLILTDKSGNVTEIRKGDSVIIPKGFSGTWEAPEVFRELIVVEAKSFAAEQALP
jgi:uncharacterized cupin superfamily protein